eukprot:CAMPEP_0119318124 /NCGR_PEP_ID=MMETSP1333-20130426/45481_1 /TAXON_ID=418940 /ORGANISM="Scyphosphaera apsteinii, Strain RCC1455" /LENGTH=96 /DNA_ID=CAMNT_0007324247 /DNA_START=357 /DNA_END=645 /DNA_ORIENTATION=+
MCLLDQTTGASVAATTAVDSGAETGPGPRGQSSVGAGTTAIAVAVAVAGLKVVFVVGMVDAEVVQLIDKLPSLSVGGIAAGVAAGAAVGVAVGVAA